MTCIDYTSITLILVEAKNERYACRQNLWWSVARDAEGLGRK